MSVAYWSFFAILCAWILKLAATHLSFHRLRHFPGPRLAALTTWYSCYYDVFKDGGRIEILEKLHETYGPVVRFGPNELHFSDPQAFAAIYSMNSKFTKEPWTYKAFDENESSFGYLDPRIAKARRDVLSPLFSRRAILRLERHIQEKVDKLISRLLSYQDLDKPANLSLAFRSTTVDIITSYCFAESYDVLDAEDFRHPMILSMQAGIPVTWTFKHFPFLQTFVLGIPAWLSSLLGPVAQAVADMNVRIDKQIDAILENPESLEKAEHEIIYHHLLNRHSGKSQTDIPSRNSLRDEAQNLLFAGSDTVANTCTVGSFHVLNNREVLAKLKDELHAAWPELDMPVNVEVLEKLPYLTAVIKESLRISNGVVHPLPRVVGPGDAKVAGSSVPAGTVISMGSTFMHKNPEIFPNPLKFVPERWLQSDARELENYLVPFSKGPRSCIGMNLAWCELYLLFANVFRKLELEVYNTTVDDFKFRSYFLPLYRGRNFYAKIQSSLN